MSLIAHPETGKLTGIAGGWVVVTATAIDGSEVRAELGIKIGSSDASLNAIDVDGGRLVPEFNSGIFLYEAKLPVGSQSTTLLASASDDDAIVKGDGDFDLSNGSIVTEIEVAAIDGINKEKYIVHISATDTLTAGVKSINNLSRIYPNPTNGRITIEVSGEEVSEYSLYSIKGKLMEGKKSLNAGVNIIDLTHLKNGVYLLDVKVGIKVETHRIILNSY